MLDWLLLLLLLLSDARLISHAFCRRFATGFAIVTASLIHYLLLNNLLLLLLLLYRRWRRRILEVGRQGSGKDGFEKFKYKFPSSKLTFSGPGRVNLALVKGSFIIGDYWRWFNQIRRSRYCLVDLLLRCINNHRLRLVNAIIRRRAACLLPQIAQRITSDIFVLLLGLEHDCLVLLLKKKF